MGRNRTPTDILDARGGFLTHKDRQRPNEPTNARSIGSPPKSLTKAEKLAWKELAKQCCPGVLKESDRLMFGVLVRLAAKFYAREPAMTASETAQMITLSSKFALNPADRSKVIVEKPKKTGLAAFLAKKAA
jgi:phage terminase small subunit